MSPKSLSISINMIFRNFEERDKLWDVAATHSFCGQQALFVWRCLFSLIMLGVKLLVCCECIVTVLWMVIITFSTVKHTGVGMYLRERFPVICHHHAGVMGAIGTHI